MGDGRERAQRSWHTVTDGTNDMPSGDATGRAVYVQGPSQLVTVKASGAETASATGAAVTGLAGVKDLLVELDVTAASGTLPTLDVWVQTSVDGTNWTDIARFAQMTAAGTRVARLAGTASPSVVEEAVQAKAIAVSTVRQGPWGDRLRYLSTIAGTTPSFTYSVKAYAR